MLRPSVVAIVIWIGCSTPWRRPTSSTRPTIRSTAADRVVLEPEREREVEHDLGVGRALDRREQRLVDREHQLTPNAVELADEPVVHPEPVAVAEGVRVRLLDRRPRGRADVREEERRGDPGGDLAQVAVVPRRMDAAVDPRRLALLVPTDAEAVAVRRRRALPRVQALVDQRAVALDQQLLEPDRRSRVGEPATHVSYPRLPGPPRQPRPRAAGARTPPARG